jgi:uncharacterized membrane protein
MADYIIQFLETIHIPHEFILFLISMTPIIELRGALIAAPLLDVGFWQALLICIIGNMLPVPFIILLARPVFTWLKKRKIFSRFTSKFEDKIAKKADKVMKNAAIGLFLFVAIPMPGTGAWTGSLIASLFNMRFKYALPSIFAGVVVAGLIVSLGAYSVVGVFNFLL